MKQTSTNNVTKEKAINIKFKPYANVDHLFPLSDKRVFINKGDYDYLMELNKEKLSNINNNNDTKSIENNNSRSVQHKFLKRYVTQNVSNHKRNFSIVPPNKNQQNSSNSDCDRRNSLQVNETTDEFDNAYSPAAYNLIVAGSNP